VTHDIQDGPIGDGFPFVVTVDLLEHVADVDASFAAMSAMLTDGGRLIATTSNPRWSPVLHAAERLGLKMPEGDHEWRSRDALVAAADSAGLRLMSFDRSLLVPKGIPVLRTLNEAPWAGALRARAGLIQRAVFTRR